MRAAVIPDFFGRSREELWDLLRTDFSITEAFRADQLYEWLYASPRARPFQR